MAISWRDLLGRLFELKAVGHVALNFAPEMQANTTIKTLYLIGPSSSGKSTLFRAIMENMGLDPRQCITEVARTVVENTNFSKETIGYVHPRSISNPLFDI